MRYLATSGPHGAPVVAVVRRVAGSGGAAVGAVVTAGKERLDVLADWERRTWQLGFGMRLLPCLALWVAHPHFRALAQRDALAASRAFTQGVLDSVGRQIAVVDRDGTIVAVNAAWLRFALHNAPVPGRAVDGTPLLW